MAVVPRTVSITPQPNRWLRRGRVVMTDLDTIIRAVVREEIARTGLAAAPARAETVAMAAERLSVDPKTVRRLIQRGELRGVRVGTKALRVLTKDVDALLASEEATS